MSGSDEYVDTSRVIVHLDVDCFGVQLLRKRNHQLLGQPVVARNQWFPSAVSYEARARWPREWGEYSRSNAKKYLKQWMRLDRQIHFLPAPTDDDEKIASEQLYAVVNRYLSDKYDNRVTVEYNSRDELYVDLTQACNECYNSYGGEYLSDLNAIVEDSEGKFNLGDDWTLDGIPITEAVVIVSELRRQIQAQTQLICSAGISFNKFMAKIVCGLNKPDKITVMTDTMAMNRILHTIDIGKTEGLGGVLGQSIGDVLGVNKLTDLRQFCRMHLDAIPEWKALNLWHKCRGIDNSAVRFRLKSSETYGHKTYDTEIDCNCYPILTDLMAVCRSFADRLKSKEMMARRLRIELYTRLGLNNNTTIDLMFETNNADEMMDAVMDTDFPHIGRHPFRYICEFRIIAIDL